MNVTTRAVHDYNAIHADEAANSNKGEDLPFIKS
jgi:hypothetical protein